MKTGMRWKIICVGLFAVLSMATARIASAATLQLVTDKDTFAIGDQFSVNVKIDSEGAGINAAQGTIQIAKDVLEFVSVDKANSVFNFWITDPTFSNETGQLSFVGGSTSGFSGKALQVLKVTFRVKGSGKTDLVFTDGAVTASDGSGTNVLSAMKGLSISVVPKSELTQIISKPTQITRPAEKAAKLPAKPELVVSGYKDPSQWYNVSARFSVQMALPADVTDVATAVNKEPSFAPTQSEGLFDNKLFTPLEDGIWYLHVRFRNNVGWGPTTHYRIAIDTMPPPSLQVKVQEGASTEIPTPTIEYRAADGLSRVKRYFLQMDGGEIKTLEEEGTYKFNPLKPGKHVIRFGVEDNAGNITENRVDLEILPIEAPKIVSLARETYVGEGNLQVIGSALADAIVTVSVNGVAGELEQSLETKADGHGNWTVILDKPLTAGDYVVTVVARDSRGAMSIEVKSDMIRVRPRPFLTINGLELSLPQMFVTLIALILAGIGGIWMFLRLKSQQQSRKVIICQRDVSNMLAAVKKDVDKILEKYSDDRIDEAEVSEIKYLAKKIGDTVEKNGKYCIESIGEITK